MSHKPTRQAIQQWDTFPQNGARFQKRMKVIMKRVNIKSSPAAGKEIITLIKNKRNLL